MVFLRCPFVEKEAESGEPHSFMLSLHARLRRLCAQSSYRPGKHWSWALNSRQRPEVLLLSQ